MDKKGFSLIEVMITLTVLGIVAAVSAPAFMSLAPNMELKDAAAELYGTVQQAKIHAIKTNSLVGVRVGTDGYTVGEPFDDAVALGGNGNGLHDAGEAYTDTDGNGNYTAVKVVNFANDYDYGIGVGFQGVTANNAGNDWNGVACQLLGGITFNSRGLVDSFVPAAGPPARFYLENQDQLFSYAVEARVAGSVNTRKFDGTIWQL